MYKFHRLLFKQVHFVFSSDRFFLGVQFVGTEEGPQERAQAREGGGLGPPAGAAAGEAVQRLQRDRFLALRRPAPHRGFARQVKGKKSFRPYI